MTDARRGALFGLSAAALFGASAPVAKLLLAEVSPQILAGLLYLGAGLGLTAYRALRPRTAEAPLTRADAPKLVGVVVAGGVAGPLLMMLGLERTGALSASLLLNLEAVFTIALAALVFGEHLGRRVIASAGLVVIGAAVLRAEPGSSEAEAMGVLFLAAACASWAVDNNLTQRLSVKDPVALVQVKTLAAGAFNTALGLALAGGAFPPLAIGAVALVLGLLSYGVSVVLDAYALRLVGAAREAAYFATAPFLGAGLAVVLSQRLPHWTQAVAMLAMAAGVVLLLRERHGHLHRHDPLEHTHLHVHDAHHQHAHHPGDPQSEPHAHHHRHEVLAHDHPHLPDEHHRHGH